MFKITPKTDAYPDFSHDTLSLKVSDTGQDVHLTLGGAVLKAYQDKPQGPWYTVGATLTVAEARAVGEALLAAAASAEQYREPTDDEGGL